MKKLLFCLLILFLSGCSLNYRLEINEDNNFNEIVSFSDKNSNLMKQNEDLDVAFDLLKDYYKNHEGIYPGVNVPKKFKRINDGDTSFASLLMKKKSLTELDNSLYLNRFFNLIELNNNSNIVSLYFYDFNYEKLENMLNEKNININDVNLRIKCIYEVEYSNHDYYDENNNEYVWNLDKDVSVSFKYNLGEKKDLVTNNNIVDDTIGEIIYSVTGMEKNEENDKKVKNYSIIALFGISFILILLIILIIKKKITKNDEI